MRRVVLPSGARNEKAPKRDLSGRTSAMFKASVNADNLSQPIEQHPLDLTACKTEPSHARRMPLGKLKSMHDATFR